MRRRSGQASADSTAGTLLHLLVSRGAWEVPRCVRPVSAARNRRNDSRSPSLLGCLWLSFGPGPARADDPDPDAPAPPPAAQARSVGQVTATATRAERDVLDVAGNVTVLDREAIEKSGARDVPELLRRESGLFVTNDIGNPEGYRVEARGFNNGGGNGSALLVLMDGRRLNEADSSFIDWSLVHLDRVERIEIVRGPASALYGDNAMGGVIQIFTRDAGGAPHAELNGRFGSYQEATGSLLAGASHGPFTGSALRGRLHQRRLPPAQRLRFPHVHGKPGMDADRHRLLRAGERLLSRPPQAAGHADPGADRHARPRCQAALHQQLRLGARELGTGPQPVDSGRRREDPAASVLAGPQRQRSLQEQQSRSVPAVRLPLRHRHELLGRQWASRSGSPDRRVPEPGHRRLRVPARRRGSQQHVVLVLLHPRLHRGDAGAAPHLERLSPGRVQRAGEPAARRGHPVRPRRVLGRQHQHRSLLDHGAESLALAQRGEPAGGADLALPAGHLGLRLVRARLPLPELRRVDRIRGRSVRSQAPALERLRDRPQAAERAALGRTSRSTGWT